MLSKNRQSEQVAAPGAARHHLIVSESAALRRLANANDPDANISSVRSSSAAALLTKKDDKDAYCLDGRQGENGGTLQFFKDFLRNGNKSIHGQNFPHFCCWLAGKIIKEEGKECELISTWLQEKSLDVESLLQLGHAELFKTEILGQGAEKWLNYFIRWLKEKHEFTESHIHNIENFYSQNIEDPFQGLCSENMRSECSFSLNVGASVNYTVDNQVLHARGTQNFESIILTITEPRTLEFNLKSETDVVLTNSGFRVESLHSSHPLGIELVTRPHTIYELEFRVKLDAELNPEATDATKINVQETLQTILLRALHEDQDIFTALGNTIPDGPNKEFQGNFVRRLFQNLKSQPSDIEQHLKQLIQFKQMILEALAQDNLQTPKKLLQLLHIALEILSAYAQVLLQNPKILGKTAPRHLLAQLSPFAYAMHNPDALMRVLKRDKCARNNLGVSEEQVYQLSKQEHARVLIKHQGSLAVQAYYADEKHPGNGLDISVGVCNPVIKIDDDSFKCRDLLAKLNNTEFKPTENELIALSQFIFGDALIKDFEEPQRSRIRQENIAFALRTYPLDMCNNLFERTKVSLFDSRDVVSWLVQKNKKSNGLEQLFKDIKRQEHRFIFGKLSVSVADFFIWARDKQRFQSGHVVTAEDLKVFLTEKYKKAYPKIETRKAEENLKKIFNKLNLCVAQGFSTRLDFGTNGMWGIDGFALSSSAEPRRKIAFNISEDAEVNFSEEIYYELKHSNHSDIKFILPPLIARGTLTPEGTRLDVVKPGDEIHRQLCLPQTSEAGQYTPPIYAPIKREGETSKQATQRVFLSVSQAITEQSHRLHIKALFQVHLLALPINDSTLKGLENALLKSDLPFTESQHRYFLDKHGFNYILNRLTKNHALTSKLFRCLTKQEVENIYQSRVARQWIGKFYNRSKVHRNSIFSNKYLAELMIRYPRKFGIPKPTYESVKNLHLQSWAFRYHVAKMYGTEFQQELQKKVQKGFFSLRILKSEADEIAANLSEQWRNNPNAKWEAEHIWKITPELTDKELITLFSKQAVKAKMSPLLTRAVNRFIHGIYHDGTEQSVKAKALDHIATRLHHSKSLSKALYKLLEKSASDAIRTKSDTATQLIQDLVNLVSIMPKTKQAQNLLSNSFWRTLRAKRISQNIDKVQQQKILLSRPEITRVKGMTKDAIFTARLRGASKPLEQDELSYQAIGGHTGLKSILAKDPSRLIEPDKILDFFIEAAKTPFKSRLTHIQKLSVEQLHTMFQSKDTVSLKMILFGKSLLGYFDIHPKRLNNFLNFSVPKSHFENNDFTNAYSNLMLNIAKGLKLDEQEGLKGRLVKQWKGQTKLVHALKENLVRRLEKTDGTASISTDISDHGPEQKSLLALQSALA